MNGRFEFEDSDDVEHMAAEFNEKLVKIMEDARTKCRIKPKSKQAVLINELDKAEYNIIKKNDVKNKFYSFVNAIKKGFTLDEEETEDKPNLEDLGRKLEKKYAELYRPNRDLADATIERIFKLEDQDLQGRWISNKKKFKQLILSTSSSGAKDCFKLSLKHTKAMLGSSSQLRDQFQKIAKKCLQDGIFPNIWKEDTISFLYKRKGDRLDAANWRPITIAASIGKHLEKVISELISVLDDKNADNHAYTAGRSCLSAITAVQKCFYENAIWEDRNLGSGKIKNFRLVTIISADDIASAFESIDHVTIEKIFERCFRNDSRFKIGKILRSYLHRKSVAVDRTSNQSYCLKKVFEDQTAPQGSLLSPKLWRLFDCAFSRLHVDCLREVVIKTEYIEKIDHVAYADDHLTILLVKIYNNESEDQADIQDDKKPPFQSHNTHWLLY